MGYLFIALALAAGTTKGFCGKKTSGFARDAADSMLINTVRMLFCIVIGFAFVLIITGSVSSFAVNGKMLLICALSGIFTSIFVVTWLLAIRSGAYMMIDVFLMLGVLVPLVMCNFVYGEKIVWLKWVGIAVLLAAVYIMCSYNNSIKQKLSVRGLLLVILCGLSNGFTQFTQKWYSYENLALIEGGFRSVDATVFNFYTYIFSAITLFLCWLVFAYVGKKQRTSTACEIEESREPFNFKKIIGYVLIMSLCLFLHSYALTLAANHLSSSEIYPLQQGVQLVLTMFMASICFGEKITKKSILGVCLTFIALLLINVLPAFI